MRTSSTRSVYVAVILLLLLPACQLHPPTTSLPHQPAVTASKSKSAKSKSAKSDSLRSKSSKSKSAKSAKSAAAKAASTPPAPTIVLVAPELLGQKCEVEERTDSEDTTVRYVGRLLSCDDDKIELETPDKLFSKARQPTFFGIFKTVSSARTPLDENHSIPRAKIASIRAMEPGEEQP